ncbi:hypothetical protein LOC68_27025 [Blastopirellula sp. JC732]|uniref:Uncharacterized protein n=1 Tax=Blastopirellula sediminis TaxID=2894196 RepID=A0A9X1MRJ3_9BACT|nr:hypothetical protein [Blastopirellula sediminis]MCC9604638.1 hypothetical protein [Blastopirellula sediminis]MCC9632063.1 hypothetical protein [Blastopirellula sediminis]
MQIDATSAAGATTAAKPASANEQLQSLFSEILEQTGRTGYASADDYSSDLTLAEDVRSSWENWFSPAKAASYAADYDPAQLKQDYGDLLVRALSEGGYEDPQNFLKSLSQSELATIQHVQRLADPIRVDGLNEEGALNLLIPPPAQVDLNFDGLTQTGLGLGIRFPDSRTPKNVADAWEEATADLSPQEKMHRELQMKLPVLFANMVIDDQGSFVRQREPGDVDWVNPMASGDYSYVDYTQQNLDYLQAYRYQMSPEQYEQGMQFWSTFQQLLKVQGAH